MFVIFLPLQGHRIIYVNTLNGRKFRNSIGNNITIACSPGNEFGLDKLQNGNTIWVNQTLVFHLPTNPAWSSVASSSDGAKLVGCITGGAIWTGILSAGSWTWALETGLPLNSNWHSVASSSDGITLIACRTEDIYTIPY